MTLRSRLLLSALLLSLSTTLLLALVVRNAWQEVEAKRFREEFDQTIAQLQETLTSAAPGISSRLSPLCAHDPIIDSALVGLASGTIASRLLSIRARIPELKSSLSLDELVLISNEGAILGGRLGSGALGAKEFVALTEGHLKKPGFQDSPKRKFVGACRKREGPFWVALLGTRDLNSILKNDSSNDFILSVISESQIDTHGGPKRDLGPVETLVREVKLEAMGGLLLRASRSRSPLLAALKHLDTRVFTAVAGTLLGALLLAFFLSRGLARPVVAFAEKTRQAVRGTVQALPISGGPELEQAARSFNATLKDLHALRIRLKATERIAARREVARQIAHEIKNPLSPIRTSIETLRKLRAQDNPLFDTYFEEVTSTVLEEVRKISNLVGNFSEYARLPSPKPQAVDLGELSARLVRLHQDLGTPITLTQEELPTVIADQDQISQVLTNLLKNAIEATEDVPVPKIHLELRLANPKEDNGSKRQDQSVEILVSDNGSGVRGAALKKLFEPYSTTKKGGTGLGLPISHRIAIEHGGDLTYATTPEGGACFTLHLPTSGPPILEEPLA